MSGSQIIIDVREPAEFEAGHVKDAINIPPSELLIEPNKLSDVPKDTKLIVYCRTGSRSNASIKVLERLGFTNLTNGINAGHVVKYLLD